MPVIFREFLDENWLTDIAKTVLQTSINIYRSVGVFSSPVMLFHYTSNLD